MLAIGIRNTVHHVALNASIAILLLAGSGCSSLPDKRPRFLSTHSPAPASAPPVAVRRSERQLSQDWNNWGSENLKNGDVIFIYGQSHLLMGLINFTEFSSNIADSRFSHVGIISIEDGKPYVYDTVSGGPRRKELGWYLARDKIKRVAFRRPRAELAHDTRDVIEFCQQVYQDRVPFDERFHMDDDKYSCAEFVELAYRQQGIPLCPPIPIDELPNFAEVPKTTVMMVEAMTSISRKQPILLPGNESFGIWSSPALQLLLPEQSPQQGPRQTEISMSRRSKVLSVR